jgi:alpha-1,6-mannosyltransferase
MAMAIGVFAASAVVFRCDMVVFAGPVILCSLVYGWVSLGRTLAAGVTASLASIAFTVGVDSLFWSRWLWPELEVLLYNTVENKSSDWGTSPWHWYFSNALPRALTGAAVLVVVALVVSKKRVEAFKLLLPAVLFVSLYSFLPHKELRFVLPAVPLVNCIAALGLVALIPERATRPSAVIKTNPVPRWLRSLVFMVACLGLVASLALSIFSLQVSAANYPGGVAFQAFHGALHADPTLPHTGKHVFICDMACTSGVSRFGEDAGLGLVYHKLPLEPLELAEAGMDYAIIEAGVFADTAALHAQYTPLLTRAVDGQPRVYVEWTRVYDLLQRIAPAQLMAVLEPMHAQLRSVPVPMLAFSTSPTLQVLRRI